MDASLRGVLRRRARIVAQVLGVLDSIVSNIADRQSWIPFLLLSSREDVRGNDLFNSLDPNLLAQLGSVLATQLGGNLLLVNPLSFKHLVFFSSSHLSQNGFLVLKTPSLSDRH